MEKLSPDWANDSKKAFEIMRRATEDSSVLEQVEALDRKRVEDAVGHVPKHRPKHKPKTTQEPQKPETPKSWIKAHEDRQDDAPVVS